MDTALHRYGPLVGRILIAFIFVFSGFGKVTGFDAACEWRGSPRRLLMPSDQRSERTE